MSGRKRTKRKNSEEDFDVDEGEDGFELDDINTWACHSCTFVNRAAAFRCNVCGTRKGTSTRRSRCNDNVVEMQKSITDMVQKQMEKEKSLKRKERSMIKSVTRDEGETSAEVKTEKPDETVEQQKIENVDATIPAETVTTTTIEAVTPKLETAPEVKTEVIEKHNETRKSTPVTKTPEEKKPREYKKKSPKLSRDSTPYLNGTSTPSTITVPHQVTVAQMISQEMTPVYQAMPPVPYIPEMHLSPCSSSPKIVKNSPEVKIETAPQPQPSITIPAVPSVPNFVPQPSMTITPEMLSKLLPETAKTTKPPEISLLHHLPERVVKKLNHQLPYDFEVLRAHKRMTGIDPIIADTEAVLLPNNWDKQKVMRELASSLGANHIVSPTTSRQSSETDSSSSDGNRSFETPLSDAHQSVSKCCQIPDYMIHRDAPQKIFIVANGYPAFFEEFPRRI
ncbi:unnamed protein product [Caenorhabditis brenneri]